MTKKNSGIRETVLIVGTAAVAIISLLSFTAIRDSNANQYYRDYGRPAQSARL